MDLNRPTLQNYMKTQREREQEEKEANEKAPVEPSAPRTRSNKTRRLYDDHSRMLADQAHKITMEKRVKISESDIIAEALDMWCAARGVEMEDYR